MLRKAGDLFAAHADELREWLVREAGDIPGKADFELHVAAQECYEAAALAAASPYGLALGIVTTDTARDLDLAERIPTGIVHINDQTVNDEAVAPFGGVAASGTGSRFGGDANLDAFTEVRWTTVRGDVARYPF